MNNELKILLAIIAGIVIYLFLTDSTSNMSENENETENFYNPTTYPWTSNTGNYGKMDILDDGANGNAGLNFNMCSPSCCSPQYPPSFPMPVDPMICMSGQDFVPSPYTCKNDLQNSGCLCMTKDQSDLLYSRGGNA